LKEGCGPTSEAATVGCMTLQNLWRERHKWKDFATSWGQSNCETVQGHKGCSARIYGHQHYPFKNTLNSFDPAK